VPWVLFFSLVVFPFTIWIISSNVSHVIFHYDNHLLKSSVIHMIVMAISWVLCRISCSFFLMAFMVWDEPHPLLTSFMA
jgi:hypothetical protein